MTIVYDAIAGTYPLSPQLPAVGGNEMVGMVTEIGARVTSVRPGDHVIAAGPGLGIYCVGCMASVPIP